MAVEQVFADVPEWVAELSRSPPKANGANGYAPAHEHAADRNSIIARLPPEIATLIDTEAEHGKRSDHSYHVMCRLFERGLSDLDVRLVADGAPFARKFWTRGNLLQEISRARGKWERAVGRHSRSGPDWRTVIVNAADLQRQEFPPVSWVVPALIPEGLTLLAGRPKIGKSWLALDLCLGVASDAPVMGGIKPTSGDVLYAALEDNPRRLQRRIDKLASPFGTTWPSRLTLATSWQRLDQGGAEDIAAWCDSAPAPKLVVLDTLAGCRPVRTNTGYAEDYEALAAVHRLANDRGIGVLALHHVRKMEAEDPIDQVSGTLGLTGAADTVMVLNRTGHGTTLYGRGRDLEEFDRAVEFNRETCRWRLLGNADEVRQSDTRKAILAVLSESGEGMKPADIAAACGSDGNAVRQRLHHMCKDGEVAKAGTGKYRLPEKGEG